MQSDPLQPENADSWSSIPIAVWDFARSKSKDDETIKRIVAEIFAAFWRDELGISELSLAEDSVIPQVGFELTPGFPRDYLAAAALTGAMGRKAFDPDNPMLAYQQLVTWGANEYSGVDDSYRDYFLPQKPGRGLCAPPDVLEVWYSKRHSSPPEPSLASQTSSAEKAEKKKKPKPKSKFFQDEKVIKFFEDRVPDYLPDDYPPTEDDDWKAAEKAFPDIGRKQLRLCRAKAYENQGVENWIGPGPNNKTVGKLTS